MHPEHQPGIGGCVGVPSAPAVDATVRGARDHADALRLLLGAEDDRIEGGHRARETTPRILLEVRVVDDSRGDERMRSLHEQRAGTAEHQHRLAGDAPDCGVLAEISLHQHVNG